MACKNPNPGDSSIPLCNLPSPCNPIWDVVDDPANCYQNDLIDESLQIAGAPINVYKLLGVHEQGKLVDLTDKGEAISGGDVSCFPSSNAFFNSVKQWRSFHRGSLVVSNSYIGYDFGPIKLSNGRERYGIETEIRYQITTIVIKQGSNSVNRATKVRIERSDNGVDWFGVAIVMLLDDDQENQISFKQSAPARYWRLRPIEFNGGIGDYWSVISLKLMDYNETDITDIQDLILLENRDRDYSKKPVNMKAYYDILDVQSEITRFGLELPSQIYFMDVHFLRCVAMIGRPMVIGDIIEMPSEVQYSPSLEPILKFMEITDVGWSPNSFTVAWKPTLLRLVLQPAMASQETQDVFGDLAYDVDPTGLFDIDTDKYQSLFDSDATIAATADSQVPEEGEDIAEIAEIPNEQVPQGQIDKAAAAGIDMTKLNVNPKGLYVEDGIPPNGIEYTEADDFPATPSNGDYHRLTYIGFAEDIPPRLYRWSITKNRWIYLETDRRFEFNHQKTTIEKLLADPDAVPTSKIDK